MAAIQLSIDQDYVDQLIEEKFSERLDGKSWDINDFRKNCCFNKSAEWVRLNVILPFADEIDYKKGGWCINPHGGRGQKQLIFAKAACEWMERNKRRINWGNKV
ncbi:DUF771 domain-containing protein [Ligilactobacillus saerimneri]|uniref:DUF771 domain-containing protein n=1 Tax=Ligilactobacillus saerimneri TaxID=228229 RepID=UPI001C1188A4|nr:DUF771 domain-containing protein [Ligilactobacillus saerimneri]MBU5309266.1 DUF771 domain-containing protein [Ligilactobacillus saerimneri]